MVHSRFQLAIPGGGEILHGAVTAGSPHIPLVGYLPAFAEHILHEDIRDAGELFAGLHREVERFRAMQHAGLTDLALRGFDDPWESLETIKDRVIPHFQ